jgi:hypothetical protein
MSTSTAWSRDLHEPRENADMTSISRRNETSSEARQRERSWEIGVLPFVWSEPLVSSTQDSTPIPGRSAPVPLSEHEQRLLDQIERALYAEDPKFASVVRSTDLRSHLRRRIKRMSAVFVVGFAVLIASLVIQPSQASTQPLIGVAGFAIMVAAGWLIARSWLKLNGRVSDAPRLHTDRPQARVEGGWRARFEDRWRRRFDDRDY